MKFEITLPMTAKGFKIIFPLKYLLALLIAFTAFAVVASPAQAIHPFRRNVVVQRQVIRQPIVRQRVVVQQVVAQPVYQHQIVQRVYAQPVVVQPVVQSYSQQVCYPQAQIVAPVYGQQVVQPSCAAFFAK